MRYRAPNRILQILVFSASRIHSILCKRIEKLLRNYKKERLQNKNKLISSFSNASAVEKQLVSDSVWQILKTFALTFVLAFIKSKKYVSFYSDRLFHFKKARKAYLKYQKTAKPDNEDAGLYFIQLL